MCTLCCSLVACTLCCCLVHSHYASFHVESSPGSEFVEEVATVEKQHSETCRALDEALQHLDAHDWHQTSGRSLLDH